MGDLGIYGRIILKCTLEKYGVTLRTVFVWLKTEFMGGLPNQLNDCRHLKNGLAP